MSTISQVAKALKKVLTTGARSAGVESGFVQRKSKLSASKWVQTLCFGYLANSQATLCELSQMAMLTGCQITAQGLDERFSYRAAECLSGVLRRAVDVMITSNKRGETSTLLRKFSEVRVTDSTTIEMPNELSGRFRGCGSRAKKVDASIKASVSLELRTGRLIGPELGEGRTADMKLAQEHPPIQRGGLDLSDLAYFSIERLKELDDNKAYFISHFQYHTLIFDQSGKKYRVLDLLENQTGKTVVDRPIFLSNERLPCRFVAVPVDKAIADERRAKIRIKWKARGGGRKLSKERLKLADWNIYVTNVPEAMLTSEQVTAMGRVRWQIELLFKLWKSLGRIDESRSEKPENILCQFYAKLLAMIVGHWAMLTGGWRKPNYSAWKAVRLIGTYAASLCSAIRHDQVGAILKELERNLTKTCRKEKRKKNPATFQLLTLSTAP